jgi:hypothetical protein
MSIFDRLSPERIAKAYQHPEGGKFIRQSDAKQMAAEHKELADGAKKELDNLGEQMRGTPEGAAEAASPADHFAAVGYHVKEAAAHGAAAQTEARQAHTAAAHAHYKAGHANTEASSEKAREATEEAHAASKGNDNFKPVPVRKADVLAGVRKFNENHGSDGRFSAGGSDYSMQGGQPAKAVYGSDAITGHRKVVGYQQGDKVTADYNKYKTSPGQAAEAATTVYEHTKAAGYHQGAAMTIRAADMPYNKRMAQIGGKPASNEASSMHDAAAEAHRAAAHDKNPASTLNAQDASKKVHSHFGGRDFRG